MLNQVPCLIRWGYRFTDGDHKGGLGIHADIPLDFWPSDEERPTFITSTSVWKDGHLVAREPWHQTVPFAHYYEPRWIKEMWTGLERWEYWQAYERQVKKELERITAHLWLPHPDGDKDTLPEGMTIYLPDKETMLRTIGFLSQPQRAVH